MLNRTSSHIWGRWYWPMFLLRDRLLTCMYTVSLFVSWGSAPPSLLFWNFPLNWCDLWCYNGHIWGKGVSDVLWTLPKSSWWSLIYFSSHSTLSHLYLYMTTLVLAMWSLSLGTTRRFLMVLPPLNTFVSHVFFIQILCFHLGLFVHGTTMLASLIVKIGTVSC